MNKPTYKDISDLYNKLASKYAELSNTYLIIEETSQELSKTKEQFSILDKRFHSLVEENTLNKQLLQSKSVYIDELEAELDMIQENQLLQENFSLQEKDKLINTLQSNLDSIYSSINLNILLDHCEYISELEKDGAPFAFEEIKEYLKLLINLKEDYDQRQENDRDENLLEF